MEKIRVAFFADVLVENFDTATRTMFQLIRRIPRHRFEFLFICGSGPDKLYGCACLCIPSIRLSASSAYKIALPQLAADELAAKLKAFNPDVVHIATPSLLGAFALQYASRQQLPVISIYHTHYLTYVDYYLKWMPFLIGWVKPKVASLKKEFYNHCQLLYVPGNHVAQQLYQLGVQASHIKIWKRGIDTLLYSPRKRNQDLINYLTGNQHWNVLTVIQPASQPDLETLFGIYDGMQGLRLACNLIIAGDGVAKKQCQKRMPNAIFTGRLEQNVLAELYASADMLLSADVSEYGAEAVLEAMASGLPCVVANEGAAADLVEDGVNGFKCRQNQPADYVEKVELLITDDLLHDRMRRKAHHYSKQLDWSQLAETYFNDISQLAAGSISAGRHALLFPPGKTG